MDILREDEWKLVFYHLDFGHLIICQKVCKLWYKWINDIYREMTSLTMEYKSDCFLYCNIDDINRKFKLTQKDVNIAYGNRKMRYKDKVTKLYCQLMKKLTNLRE